MRSVDLLVSCLGILILSPFLLLIAFLIKLTTEGPVFYRGVRVGKDGRLFNQYKFRSMVVHADRMGKGITSAGDPRITGIGAGLRRYKLDELPQLINVLRGEMSLVGPRPEDPRYVAFYTPEQLRVLDVRPGITSPASLEYRSEEEMLSGDDWERTYVEQVLPHKLRIEMEYLERRNLRSDVGIVIKTILALFLRSRKPSWSGQG